MWMTGKRKRYTTPAAYLRKELLASPAPTRLYCTHLAISAEDRDLLPSQDRLSVLCWRKTKILEAASGPFHVVVMQEAGGPLGRSPLCVKGSRCITKKGTARMFVQQVHLRGRCVAPDAAPQATSRQLRMVSASLLLKSAPRTPDGWVLLDGCLPLRYYSGSFALRKPTWRLPEGGEVRTLVSASFPSDGNCEW